MKAVSWIERFLLLSPSAGIMLPRNLRTGGYDLPGVESNTVPLIGYRPLPSDSPSNQSGRNEHESESSQVSVDFCCAQCEADALSLPFLGSTCTSFLYYHIITYNMYICQDMNFPSLIKPFEL